MSEPTTKMIFNIPTELRKKLRLAAAKEDKTMTAVLIEAIKARFGEDDAEEPKKPIPNKRQRNTRNGKTKESSNEEKPRKAKSRTTRKAKGSSPDAE